MTRSARSTTSTAPAWRLPAFVGGVVTLAVIAGLMFALLLGRAPATASGDPTPTASPIPSVPASPSEEPAPSEKPSEQPAPSDAPSVPAQPVEEPDDRYLDPVIANPDGVLPPGGVLRVIADALRVRDHGLLDSGERYLLQRGDLVVVGPTWGFGAFGPAEEDGYTWIPVGVLGTDELPEPGGQPLEFVERGWVAVGDGDTEWLELLDPRCTDDEPTLQHVSSLTEWERLACYGDRQLTFEGVLGCGGCGGLVPGTFTPEWLASPMNYDLLSVEPQDLIGPMVMHWSPDGQARPSTNGVAPILRVTGHFDDAAAADCSITFEFSTFGVQGETPIDPAVAELYCRANFVVDTYEVIGEDVDFPFG